MPEEVPYEIAEEDIGIPGYGTVRVSVLSNGQRVISGEGVEAFLRYVGLIPPNGEA